MIRLKKIVIPKRLFEENRVKELIGDTRNNMMYDCVYNDIILGEFDNWVSPTFDKNLIKTVEPKLKDYQIDDLSKSLYLDHVYNINKPGYGKTLETITWIKMCLPPVHRNILILCPKSVIETWKDQLNKYYPDYEYGSHWVITNYEQLYNAKRFEEIKDIEWDLIVLDESHRIKSMKSKITGCVFQLKSKHRHCLTGTPIKNRPEDIAAQLKWLDPYSITNYTDFQFCFCDMQRNNWGWHANGLTKNKQMVENLQKLLDLYCVGGKEHNASEQPEFIKVKLKMDAKVKELYEQVVGEYDKQLEAHVIDTAGLMERGIKVSSSIESAIRRQQLTSNPQLFDKQLKNVKFEWILDWLEGTDEKVVILSKFAKTLDELENLFKVAKIDYVRIQKEQSAGLRQQMIKKWSNSKTQPLIGTFGVLGTGVDGLQTNCHYMIFIDREWTASDNEQAEKRIWRTGQNKQCVFYILQCPGTIDVKIEKVQLDKGFDAKALLEPVTEKEELD